MKAKLKATEKGNTGGWTLLVDGQETEFTHVQVMNEKFQVGMEVGTRPEGFVGPAVYEEKGGAVTIPFSFTPDGKLLIGLLEKNRPNFNATILEAVGGMVDAGESHQEAIRRETLEEAGLLDMNMVELPGVSVWNRLYQFADIPEERGVGRKYASFIPFDHLVEEGNSRWVFSQAAQEEHDFNPKVKFLPWTEAASCPDEIAAGGILRLLAYLRSKEISF